MKLHPNPPYIYLSLFQLLPEDVLKQKYKLSYA